MPAGTSFRSLFLQYTAEDIISQNTPPAARLEAYLELWVMVLPGRAMYLLGIPGVR